jgi:putative nucleotidyltransferase with HDIG domain
VLFNVACLAIAIWTAAHLFFFLSGGAPVTRGPAGAVRLLALLAIFALVNFAISTTLVALAISFERGDGLTGIWREHFTGLWVSHVGGAFAAMLMMVLPRESALELLILIAPLPVILYVALRHALGRAEDHISHLAKMNRVYVATIEALAQAVDAKDQVTHEHVRRVQENALRLARALGLKDEAQVQAIEAASLLHDIGKIAIPEHILNKPGRLTTSEFEIMKRHAAIGADILAVIGFPYPLVPIVRHHHENWDGTGYPDRIAGDAIPIGARILQVVDCFDALTSDRPYRPRMEDAAALGIIVERRGTMYDPRVVDTFVRLHASGAVGTAAGDDAAAAPVTVASVAFPSASFAPPVHELAELGRALAAPRSPAHVGETLWTHLRTQLPAASLVLFVYDHAADAIRPAYVGGESSVAPGTTIQLGERLSGWVAATRRAIVNSDARLDLDGDIREHTTLRAALAVPIGDAADLAGVLAIYSPVEQGFTDQHQRIAEAAAHLAGAALHAAAPRLHAIAV